VEDFTRNSLDNSCQLIVLVMKDHVSGLPASYPPVICPNVPCPGALLPPLTNEIDSRMSFHSFV
jgi:hypothetical protein